MVTGWLALPEATVKAGITRLSLVSLPMVSVLLAPEPNAAEEPMLLIFHAYALPPFHAWLPVVRVPTVVALAPAPMNPPC